MRKLVFVCLVIAGLASRVWAESASWQNISGHYGGMQSFAVHPDDPGIMLAGTRQGVVLRTEDAGKNWRPVLSIAGERMDVNCMTFHPGNSNALYAATGNGLYYTNTLGKTWKRIFRGNNYLERQCMAIAVLSRALLLGTQQGLLFSEDNGRSWIKAGSELRSSSIVAIASHAGSPDIVYAAGWDGVFRSSDGGKTWEKKFSSAAGVKEVSEERLSDNEPEAAAVTPLIRSMAVDGDGTVFIATSRGVYRMHNRERNWERVMDEGLSVKDIRFITLTGRNRLAVAGLSEVMINEGGVWKDISNGLAVNKIRFLCADKQDNMYAATDKGILKLDLRRYNSRFETKKNKEGDSQTVPADEDPSIAVVQKAAIEYAEVALEKIKTWRQQAEKRALLPTLSVGIDRDRNRTISSNTWGTSGTNGTPGKYYVGPEDISTDHDENWSVSVSWDLGDLVWNDAQTSIDVRSKLMVELRGQILDEVTKLYFERLRLKAEVEELSLEEHKKRFEKDLKLREVTAMLDGLTGGAFTRKNP